MSALGFVKAVTEGGDAWLLHMPRRISPRSGKDLGSPLHALTQAAMLDMTRDQYDAAVMRCCNDDNAIIRRIYREGV
jgi:hypothetical protein